MRIYLSLRIFSNKEILRFDWLRTQIWAKKICLAKKELYGIGPCLVLCVFKLFCVRPLSCVHNLTSVTGLSILDCPSIFSNVYALILEFIIVLTIATQSSHISLFGAVNCMWYWDNYLYCISKLRFSSLKHRWP